MDIVHKILADGDSTGYTLKRRRFLTGTAALGVAMTAGCSQNTGSRQTTTEEHTTTTTQHTDETTTTTEEQFGIEEAKQKRANLTETEKRDHYQSGLPLQQGYDLDYERVRRENDSRREQLIDITATVGDQYGGQVIKGTHAVADAISNLDWMGWDQDNIINFVTRYNSRPGQEVTVNYSTEDSEGRNLDGTIARDDGSGPQTYIKDIPNSELTDGDEGNFLATDIDGFNTLRKNAKENGNTFDEDDWRGIKLSLQSIVPGINGPTINDDGQSVADRNIIFDGDAMNYIGEAYDESAEAVNELSEEALEIDMATVPIRTSERYVGVTAGEDGLEVDSVYSQEEGEKKMREPVEL
ncbi:hypothetical protein GCM10009037_06260 [Halarchaeum grantii]|uniref:Uncharacterized protein n=1 Tax=Halarchaeum grantii TaxID=1193105 RepID=A0A830EZN5_9EURY|nr:hypothetical protein [Halarchaeum grantii]GGL25419.1 hypothetical protein GCM10009037_06260 [Halarchaeum grantii]